MSGVLDNVEDFFPTLHPDVIVRSLPLPWHGLFGSLAASVHHARDWLAKQHQDVTMRRLEASKNPPLWHDLLESLTAQVAFLLCDRKIGMLSRLLLLPIKLQQRFLSLLLLEHGRLPHQGLHDFVQRILSYSRQDDWILTELYLLHDKCIQFADVSCDCGLHVDSRWLLSSVETRCQAIEDKLNYGRVDSKWLTGWKRNVDQVMIIDNDSNAEECGEMEILFGGESVSSLSFKDSCLNYKEDEYDTTEIMLNDEDTESSILVKRRKINEESDHVVPTVSPDNDNNSQDTELSQKSLFSQATPTKLKLDKMQELQDEISMFESDCTLSVDMKKAVLKLRDDVLSGSALHSEMEDELEVILMKCHTRQVSDVCSKLKCSNLTESQFTYLANRMCRLKVEPSYQTCCQFMREAFLSWFLCLQQSASRAVVSVAERLAQKFLRPFLSSIAVPLMALDTLSKVQVELLSRVIRSSLSMDDQHELLREYLVFYLASNAVWSDGTVTVLCALVDTKARFNKDMTEMLVLALERNALPFASSLLFAKLALTVVQQLNCELNCHVVRLQGIFDCNKTFLRKPGLTALEKIEQLTN